MTHNTEILTSTIANVRKQLGPRAWEVRRVLKAKGGESARNANRVTRDVIIQALLREAKKNDLTVADFR